MSVPTNAEPSEAEAACQVSEPVGSKSGEPSSAAPLISRRKARSWVGMFGFGLVLILMLGSFQMQASAENASVGSDEIETVTFTTGWRGFHQERWASGRRLNKPTEMAKLRTSLLADL